MRLNHSATVSLTWRGWLRDGNRLIRAELHKAAAMALVWRLRARGRSDLAYLDARMLEDIGMTPAQAEREIRKPFWRA